MCEPPQQEERIEATAIEAARKAGEILAARAGDPPAVDRTGRYDVKLEVDRLCEQAVVETIRRDFPDHSILAEEGGATDAPGPCRWIVDPLDGTVNYFYGLPYYCVSVACYSGAPAGSEDGLEGLGRGIVGVVYAPPTGELFVARPGRGATRNGSPIRVREVAGLSDAMLCTGYGKSAGTRRDITRAFDTLAGKVRKMRCLGAAAYDIANVACGRLSAFFETGLRTWDIAAGAIILREAGGAIEATPTRATRWNVLAAAPGLLAPLKRELHWDP